MDIQEDVSKMTQKASEYLRSPFGVLASIMQIISPDYSAIFVPQETRWMFDFMRKTDKEVMADAGDCIMRLMEEKKELEERLAIALAARPAPEANKEGRRL